MNVGLAKLAYSSLATMEGRLPGLPSFMSPEQTRSETADARPDICTPGVTLNQPVTGRLPFKDGLISVLIRKIVEHQPSF